MRLYLLQSAICWPSHCFNRVLSKSLCTERTRHDIYRKFICFISGFKTFYILKSAVRNLEPAIRRASQLRHGLVSLSLDLYRNGTFTKASTNTPKVETCLHLSRPRFELGISYQANINVLSTARLIFVSSRGDAARVNLAPRQVHGHCADGTSFVASNDAAILQRYLNSSCCALALVRLWMKGYLSSIFFLLYFLLLLYRKILKLMNLLIKCGRVSR